MGISRREKQRYLDQPEHNVRALDWSAPRRLSRSGQRSAGRMAREARPTAYGESDDRVFLLGERIADLSARISSAEYEMLTLIAEFDEARGWEVDGFGSCAEWLAWRIGVQPITARERVRTALALRDLPQTSKAMQDGELSFSKVRAITRVANSESEPALLELAHAGSAANLERVVRTWKHLTEKGELSLERRRYKRRCLSVFVDEDGMYVVKGLLTPEVGALFKRAIEAASDELFREEATPRTSGDSGTDSPVSSAQRRADAVGLISELALAKAKDSAHPCSGIKAALHQVMIHVNDETLASEADTHTEARRYRKHDGATGGGEDEVATPGTTQSRSEIDGVRVSAETIRRLACDGALVRIGTGARGEILNIGRRTRSIPPAIRRALDARDGGCRFPGCGSRFTSGHHVKHWARGGETSLSNLLLLCTRHHTAVHEGGVQVAMGTQGKVVFITPEGRTLLAAPPRVRGDRTQLPSSKSCDTGSPLRPVSAETHKTRRSSYKRDSQIPWDIEARAWDSLG